MDIELSIERMLAINYITLHQELINTLQTTSKIGPIPGFSTIPYMIDYGVVITGSTVSLNLYLNNKVLFILI